MKRKRRRSSVPLLDRYKDRPERIVDEDGESFYQDWTRNGLLVHCPHDKRGTTYQRPNAEGELCPCNRPVWPPRGRGRGESLSSPRRIQAHMQVVEMMRLRRTNGTWQQIARRYGYISRSGPYQLVRRAIEDMPGETSETAKALLLRPADVFRSIWK